MVMQNERGQNTHGKGEQVKIQLLPNNVGKKSVNDSGSTVGSRQIHANLAILATACAFYWSPGVCLGA